jgi:hypothetical protein
MKRVLFIIGIMFISLIALLETSGKNKKRMNFTRDATLEYDDVWWDN